jgi:hypothetical protein
MIAVTIIANIRAMMTAAPQAFFIRAATVPKPRREPNLGISFKAL